MVERGVMDDCVYNLINDTSLKETHAWFGQTRLSLKPFDCGRKIP